MTDLNDRYLYRAKRIGSPNVGEWVKGTYVHTNLGREMICDGTTYIGINRSCMIDIDISTLCACTGLKDKNGKLIWENDIVNCFEAECCGKISWNESEAGFYFDVLLEDGTYEEEHIYDYADCMMVIGNIFDNPELLEVGE